MFVFFLLLALSSLLQEEMEVKMRKKVKKWGNIFPYKDKERERGTRQSHKEIKQNRESENETDTKIHPKKLENPSINRAPKTASRL